MEAGSEPPDLDLKHISNVVARNVQLSLTPRLQSGRAGAYLDAKYVGKVYRDSIPWIVYALELKGSYPGKVPSSALALIFPKGTKARESLLAKTAAIRAQLEWAAPKIYGISSENDLKSYSIVVMEDVEATGYTLDSVWDSINDEQKKAILEKVADILCAAIHIRPPKDMQARLSPHPSQTSPKPNANEAATASTSSATLGDVNFTRARLSATNFEHLRKAYTLIYSGLFHPNGEPNEVAFRNRFQDFNTYTMSSQEAARVRNLHELIQVHMSDFTGGNFLPPHISGAGRGQFKDSKEKNKFNERLNVMRTILSASIFRLQHKSMQMSSFIVSFENDGTVRSVVLTQWEKAFYAPLWASCHLPSWLELLDPEVDQPAMPLEEMNKWREYMVYHLMLKKERLPRSWIWFVAHVYGELERHFEMILTATWVWNAKTEPWLKDVLQDAQKKRTLAYKKGSDPFVPLAGIKTMDVNFSECLGKWMPFARKFVAEEGFPNPC